MSVVPLRRHAATAQPEAESASKLFMKAKEFGGRYGAPYNRVLDWIRRGMPVVPDARNPYLIIVPLALEWLGRQYGFADLADRTTDDR